jgi:hypothetical protein
MLGALALPGSEILRLTGDKRDALPDRTASVSASITDF